MVVVVVTIEKESYSILAGPDIITRGFVYAKEAEDMINKIRDIAREEIENSLANNQIEWYVLKTNVKRSIERFLYDETKRRPTIFPIIMEV